MLMCEERPVSCCHPHTAQGERGQPLRQQTPSPSRLRLLPLLLLPPHLSRQQQHTHRHAWLSMYVLVCVCLCMCLCLSVSECVRPDFIYLLTTDEVMPSDGTKSFNSFLRPSGLYLSLSVSLSLSLSLSESHTGSQADEAPVS